MHGGRIYKKIRWYIRANMCKSQYSPSSWQVKIMNAQLDRQISKLVWFEGLRKHIHNLLSSSNLARPNLSRPNSLSNKITTISMCFVRSWKIGFLAMCSAASYHNKHALVHVIVLLNQLTAIKAIQFHHRSCHGSIFSFCQRWQNHTLLLCSPQYRSSSELNNIANARSFGHWTSSLIRSLLRW